ncbi:MAG: competence/damage-inducible protein A [Candidatus Omnitrophica bacterium]|nr:competence/damage-inducible protein A [Candidatus Omnitrophota bacterium]
MKHVQAEIISAGTELLLGFTVSSNSSFLSRILAGLGLDVYKHVVVGDNTGRIAHAVRAALRRAHVVVVTGGLGPTLDDVTVDGVAAGLKRTWRFDPFTWSKIERRFRARGIEIIPSMKRQARIIQGAEILPNRVGSAPGQLVRVQKHCVVLLPGVPSEARAMMEDAAQRLKRLLRLPWVIESRDFLVTGLSEPQVEARAEDLLTMGGAVTCGIYACPGSVTLRLTAKARTRQAAVKLMAPFEKKIKSRLGSHLYSADGTPLEQVVGGLLARKRLTLAVAESCTGGLVSSRLTDTPGSSRYLRSSIVAYDNREKIRLLKVPKRLLVRHGAVSADVVKAMAKSARKSAGTDLGLAVTGIAGPTGGSKAKPVGLVYIALDHKNRALCERYHFSGERKDIRDKGVQAALNLVRRALLE